MILCFANSYFLCFVLLGAEIVICDVMDQMPGISALITKLVNITYPLV